MIKILSQEGNHENSKKEILNLLAKYHLQPTLNKNPENFISRSISPSSLQSFITCPYCHFQKKKLKPEPDKNMRVSNLVHFLLDYFFRNQEYFPKSKDVLDFLNSYENEFLILLGDLNYPLIKEEIIKNVLIGFGISKKLGFEEIRKNDSISLNLKNIKDNSEINLFTLPDLTGRNKTIYEKSPRKYDNFLIDYKLNFNPRTFPNSIQTSFYYLTHLVSNRNIHNYFILDLNNSNLFKLESINLEIFIKILNQFMVLKSLNYKRKNSTHQHLIDNKENIQKSFLNNSENNFEVNDFASENFNNLINLNKELENQTSWINLGQIVKDEELIKIINYYKRNN